MDEQRGKTRGGLVEASRTAMAQMAELTGAAADSVSELQRAMLTKLLTLPLAPLRGVVWVAGQVAVAVEQERSDPVRVQARLRELAGRLAAGEITEAEFEAAEDELLDRLDGPM